MSEKILKAPFPYFGGKARVAPIVWQHLGDVSNYIEPFFGSGAVLFRRPHAPKIETINDLDCFVSNFWRATLNDPEEVARWADSPVNEADLHANHRWLVLGQDAAEFRRKMHTDPDYYDAKVAGKWVWGACCWIGSGWCSGRAAESSQIPLLTGGYEYGGRGVHQDKVPAKRPKLTDGAPDSGALGTGVHANGPHRKMPRLNGARKGDNCYGGLGVHLDKIDGPKSSAEWQQRPDISDGHGQGIHARGPSDGHRPQLADAYARGRGIHGHDQAETCADRRAWLVDWMMRLRDRLRTVRVCCGDWKRVCASPSTTTRLGLTGVFLDPPYSTEAGRCNTLYGHESGTVAHEVRAWCLERGPDPLMRIALCGYAGEGHEALEAAGWSVVAWKAAGGYGNRSRKGKDNAARERIWFSPHCVDPEDDRLPLFREVRP